MSKKLKTRPCDRAVARERFKAAVSYFETAATAADLANADDPYRWSTQSTNYVHGGIAAADAICCAILGEHAQRDDHRQAVELLGRVTPGGKELASHLSTLLGMKTLAGYGSSPLAEERAKRARRSAERLIEAARARVSG
jgi:hypothetical protein